MRRMAVVLFVATVVGFSSAANADLIDRGTFQGYHLVYDSVLNITWMDYSGHSSYSWDEANRWAAGLMLDVNGVTYDDWRLPSALNPDGTGPCSGLYCSDSEMGYLHYVELRNGGSWSGLQSVNFGPFRDLHPANYWSGTGLDTIDASMFNFGLGNQGAAYKGSQVYALGVHDGDIGAPVPIPGTVWLFAPALAGLIGLRRKFLG